MSVLLYGKIAVKKKWVISSKAFCNTNSVCFMTCNFLPNHCLNPDFTKMSTRNPLRDGGGTLPDRLYKTV